MWQEEEGYESVGVEHMQTSKGFEDACFLRSVTGAGTGSGWGVGLRGGVGAAAGIDCSANK